jgi:DNA repair photolyase
VGALIEDLDIADLERLLSETTDADAIRVYENLLRGSENHMRAFINQLSRYNQNYDPIYISDLRYNEIIGRN